MAHEILGHFYLIMIVLRIMKKIRVLTVKYDMTKTKKRTRKDMLVDNKSEEAVIAQLERIHKGEQLVSIHEIVWDEKQIKEVERMEKIEQKQLFYGRIKFFDTTKGFGFIEADDELADLFFHISALGGVEPFQNNRVEFKIGEGPKGPCAIHIKCL